MLDRRQRGNGGHSTRTLDSSFMAAHAVPAEPKIPSTPAERERWQRCIVIIEAATLQTIKHGKTFSLLNSEDHATYCTKHNIDLHSARPDITHQVCRAVVRRSSRRPARSPTFPSQLPRPSEGH